MVFASTTATMRSQLAARHCHKWPIAAFDYFQVPDNETVIKSHRAKRLQAIVGIIHQLDAYFGDFHGKSP